MDYLYNEAPSIAYRILEPPNLDGILKTPDLLKWSAVALAFVAAFGSLVRKLRALELNVKRFKPLASHEDEDEESWSSDSSDTEDGVVPSFSSLQESDKSSPLRDNLRHLVGGCEEEEDFRVAGVSRMLRFRRSNSLVDTSPWLPSCGVAGGGGVVKLWEGFGMDLRGGENAWRLIGRGKDEDYSRLVMGVWDRRMRPEVAAIAQEWKPSLEGKDFLRSNSLFANVDIWWRVDPTKAVVARLVECSRGHRAATFPG